MLSCKFKMSRRSDCLDLFDVGQLAGRTPRLLRPERRQLQLVARWRIRKEVERGSGGGGTEEVASKLVSKSLAPAPALLLLPLKMRWSFVVLLEERGQSKVPFKQQLAATDGLTLCATSRLQSIYLVFRAFCGHGPVSTMCMYEYVSAMRCTRSSQYVVQCNCSH